MCHAVLQVVERVVIINVCYEQRPLSLVIWPIPTIDSAIGYSCVRTTVVAREYSVLSTRARPISKKRLAARLFFKMQRVLSSETCLQPVEAAWRSEKRV